MNFEFIILLVLILIVIMYAYQYNSSINENFTTTQTKNNEIEQYKFSPLQQNFVGIKEYGRAIAVTKNNFPILNTFTSFYVEIYDNSMRTPHLHNCEEFGFVASGVIEILIWISSSEYTSNIASTGEFWFIPKGSLHSLNNIGEQHAVLYVGFNSPTPSNIDIGVVLNGLPEYLKNTYINSPHSLLKKYKNMNDNYFFNKYDKSLYKTTSKNSIQGYSFNLNIVPKYIDSALGTLNFVNKFNWNLLEKIKMSAGVFVINPKSSTQSFWYTNCDALYIVINDYVEFYLGIPNLNKNKITINSGEYLFVNSGTPHVINNFTNSKVKILSYYSDNYANINKLGDVLPFFTNSIINDVINAENSSNKNINQVKYTMNTISDFFVSNN